MKSVHKTLRLQHHKHTGRLLAHKHTSYRVLFLLMLIPIIAMALVEQMVGASELEVTAKIPAPMPSGTPVIETPKDGSKVTSGNVTVAGTCPVITPAVIIAIYDGTKLVGSVQCGTDGTFSVPVTLALGSHTLVATVITITDDIGASSQPVTVIYAEFIEGTTPQSDGQAVGLNGYGFGPPVRIVASDIYVLLGPDGHATWHGSFADGRRPYTVRIDWGDGNVSTYKGIDETNQEYSHDYKSVQAYKIIIQVTDDNGGVSVLYSVAITLALKNRSETGQWALGASMADDSQSTPPFITFVQKYVWQIYIGTLSGLTFLWYLEHGRHIVNSTRKIGRLHHR